MVLSGTTFVGSVAISEETERTLLCRKISRAMMSRLNEALV